MTALAADLSLAAMLRELATETMAVARATAERAKTATGREAERAANAFARLANTVRHLITLEQRIAQPPPPAPKHVPAARPGTPPASPPATSSTPADKVEALLRPIVAAERNEGRRRAMEAALPGALARQRARGGTEAEIAARTALDLRLNPALIARAMEGGR